MNVKAIIVLHALLSCTLRSHREAYQEQGILLTLLIRTNGVVSSLLLILFPPPGVFDI